MAARLWRPWNPACWPCVLAMAARLWRPWNPRLAPASPAGPSSAAEAMNPAPSASTPLLPAPVAAAGASEDADAASEDADVDEDAEELQEATVVRARLLGRAAEGDGIGLEAMIKKTTSYISSDIEVALVKCGGLPKIITAVCHYIESKRNVWELKYDFIDILKNNLYCGDLEGLFIWMQSYFRSCPDFLKPCVFYLPIFPPNYNIRRRRLLRRWIAEGYCMSTISSIAENNAETSFEKLMSLSMIQEPSQAINLPGLGINFCQINGFFHEYIMSQPKEDNMVFALGGDNQSQQYTGRHLTIRSNWDRSELFEIIDFSRLRSLTVFGEWRSFFISKKMQMLRVLDLEDTTSDVSDEDVEQIVDLMSRLKFLSLRGCTTVSRLPTSLGNLKQLETLDVRHTSITMLPETITKLQKLQYIRAGSTVPSTESQSIQPGSYRLPKFRRHQFISAHLGVKVPRGVGKLTGLDTLGVVNVGASGGNAFLKEVKNLIQLRKLAVSGINRQNISEFVSAISAHSLLNSLSMRLDKDKKVALCSVYDISKPELISLKSLKIHGDVDNFPTWMDLFFNLKKLDLEVTILTQEMIDTLAHRYLYLKCLRLCVKPTEDGEHNFSIGGTWGFNQLRTLQIDCSSTLLLAFGGDGTGRLEVLKVRSSSGTQISGLANLKGLQQVWLIGSCDNALKQDVERQLAQHPNEIKPVLKLEEVSSTQVAEHPNEIEPVVEPEEVSSTQVAEHPNEIHNMGSNLSCSSRDS
ncbi:disease resistance protein RGA4-like [Lolium rigidum]|uniref:disease resistance protein RGA4-like n=1 Tax=Lolium rigidum TaxID=89674 RepID=UPI001F5C2CC7|nr:disease resistance protein RGA4-like [Lolium rigidum]